MQEFNYETNDIIKEFKEFEKSSYARYKDLYDQIKKDRSFIAGEQFDQIDHDLTDVEGDGKAIPAMSLNVIQNAIRTIVNTYMPNQYKWNYENQPDLTKKGSDFLNDSDNSTACIEALTNAVGTALGVLVFSTDYDIDGSIKPLLYSIPDVTNVRLDPNASKLNFADATKAAIVELKSKEWLRDTYGLEAISTLESKPLIDISENYDRKNYLPLVTYYTKKDGQVLCYKLLGDGVLEEPIALPYSYIPVIPVFGESTWSTENKQSWSGITTIMRPIQRLINYSYRQIVLRSAIVPKNQWVVEADDVQNREQYWANSFKVMNPLLIRNGRSADGQTEYSMPVKVDNEIQFADVSMLMQNALGLTNSIAGIPATGLETDVEKSATEVLTNQKVFNNNVRNYIYHLKYSLQLIGLLFAEELMQQQLYGKIKVTMVAGPDDALQKQEARVTLGSYLPLITTDDEKHKLLLAECAIENENEYITRFAQSLQPVMTPGEMQANQMVEQANLEIKTRDQKILELQQQVNELQQQQQLQSYSLQQQMLLNEQKFNQQKELKLLDAQLAAGNPAEQAKTEAEVQKAEMSVEKEAISLQKERMKAASNLAGDVNNDATVY